MLSAFDHPLDDPRLTLSYAREHLDKLETALTPCQVLKLDALIHEFDPDNRRHIFRYEVPPLPAHEVALMVGDVVHNMRASLDHLVWRLARLQVEEPSRNTNFPIFDSYNKGALDTTLGEIPTEARKIIEGLQPYHRGDRVKEDLLWLLNRLCVIAKHRHINTVSARAVLEAVFPPFTLARMNIINNREVMVTVAVRDEMEKDLKPSLSIEITWGLTSQVMVLGSPSSARYTTLSETT